MESLNFTQFCKKNGYPDDYDTIFEAQILGGRGLAGSISKRAINEQDKRFHEKQQLNKQAHNEFYELVKTGQIIDASGELTKENILERERRINDKETQSKIQIIKGKIDFINSLGSLSHMKNGKLKKGYQIQVDEYNQQLEQLTK